LESVRWNETHIFIFTSFISYTYKVLNNQLIKLGLLNTTFTLLIEPFGTDIFFTSIVSILNSSQWDKGWNMANSKLFSNGSTILTAIVLELKMDIKYE